MSKADAQRAFREANYAKRAGATPKAPPAEATGEALCGHRSMNNRSCQRPAGHSEKSHRYQ